jgi:hypothetical protein
LEVAVFVVVVALEGAPAPLLLELHVALPHGHSSS